MNYLHQVSSSKNLWKLWNGPLLRNIPGLFCILSVAVYCKSSNIDAYVKKLSQILANNIRNRGGGWSQNLREALSKKVNAK